jgi:hypothetical protein
MRISSELILVTSDFRSHAESSCGEAGGLPLPPTYPFRRGDANDRNGSNSRLENPSRTSAKGRKQKFKLGHYRFDGDLTRGKRRPRKRFAPAAGSKNRGPLRGPRSSYRSKRQNYSAASAAGFLNWAVSVDAPIAVVEAPPPVTATVTASK